MGDNTRKGAKLPPLSKETPWPVLPVRGGGSVGLRGCGYKPRCPDGWSKGSPATTLCPCRPPCSPLQDQVPRALHPAQPLVPHVQQTVPHPNAPLETPCTGRPALLHPTELILPDSSPQSRAAHQCSDELKGLFLVPSQRKNAQKMVLICISSSVVFCLVFF